MGRFLMFLSLLIIQLNFSQSVTIDAQQLLTSYRNIEKVSADKSNLNAYENLEKANKTFTQNLLNFTKDQKFSTIDYKFLSDEGLRFSRSDDGLLTLFSWDKETGGSMKFFEVVAQYQVGENLYSKVLDFNPKRTFDPKCFYYQIDQIEIKGKTYYLARRKSILSSALTYHVIQAFSIDGKKLNEAAKIIKTRSGITSTLGYETDLSANANRDRAIKGLDINYSAKDKIISFPLILKNSEITFRKIQYQFTGSYFEKL